MQQIRYLIYLYLILWLIEGALRKWFLQDFATPLLVIRDPVAVLILLYAIKLKLFPLNAYSQCTILVAVISFLLAITIGHGNYIIALYGFRTIVLHVLLIFVLGAVLNKEDVVFLGKFALIIAIPMTILLTLQYGAPKEAWINQGAGGEGTAVFAGAAGKNRPPGTWSFISGPSYFYPMVVAFWIGLTVEKRAPLWLIVLSGISILIACPVSISRSLVLGCCLVCLAGVFIAINRGLWSPLRTLYGIVLLLCIWVPANMIPEFDEATNAFMARWNVSTTDRGGVGEAIIGRVMNDLSSPFHAALKAPYMGYGLGLGTQVGQRLATGSTGYALGEAEWSRILNEMGPILGFIYIGLRIWLVFALGLFSWRRLRLGNPLPLLIWTSCAYYLLNGPWGQATTLGAATIGAGLTLAASKVTEENSEDSEN